jgi:hypothetical protein
MAPPSFLGLDRIERRYGMISSFAALQVELAEMDLRTAT